MKSYKNLTSENSSESIKGGGPNRNLNIMLESKVKSFLKNPKVSKDDKMFLLTEMKDMGVDVKRFSKKGDAESKLSEQAVDKDKLIAELRADLQKAQDRLEYIENKYERQLQGLKSGLVSKLQQDLKMELDGIESIAKRLKPEDSVSLSMSVSNMNQILNMLKK